MDPKPFHADNLPCEQPKANPEQTISLGIATFFVGRITLGYFLVRECRGNESGDFIERQLALSNLVSLMGRSKPQVN
jgi:hypothetical protein